MKETLRVFSNLIHKEVTLRVLAFFLLQRHHVVFSFGKTVEHDLLVYHFWSLVSLELFGCLYIKSSFTNIPTS
jgi:hypothetical protein